MAGIMQEKFQVDNPQQPNDDSKSLGGAWITDRAARAKKMMPGREGVPGDDGDSRFVNNAVLFNGLPPGMDVEDQEVTDQRQMQVRTLEDYGDVSDALLKRQPHNLQRGFSRLQMRATDDEYSKAHVDAFYDEINVDGEIGFTERNNMLDRL